MKPLLMLPFLVLGFTVTTQAKEKPTKRLTASGAVQCQSPREKYRAFVAVGAVVGDEGDSADLVAPNGAQSENIVCAINQFSTIDVEKEIGHRTNFIFASKKDCLAALSAVSAATKELPAVIVIDKNCTPHLAN